MKSISNAANNFHNFLSIFKLKFKIFYQVIILILIGGKGLFRICNTKSTVSLIFYQVINKMSLNTFLSFTGK